MDGTLVMGWTPPNSMLNGNTLLQTSFRMQPQCLSHFPTGSGFIERATRLHDRVPLKEMKTDWYSCLDNKVGFKVHFAATKDSLSRHFNKFGDVLKVVILTDAGTGQPKGSAYVEFMRKEAAEHALSLDGTSFMSRILKVARKSAAPQEAAPVMTWPRVSRGPIFAASRFSGVPFPRGIPGMYRARLPIKAGARSFQWKRDAQTNPTETVSVFNNSVPSPITPRSLTYVRAEPKINGNSSTV